MNLNKVIIAGNLTRDPKLSYTQGGTPVCSFGLALNRRYTTAGGETRDDTCFVDVTAWGHSGELVAQYMRTGCGMLVEGRLQLDTWEDRTTGQKRSKLGVIAENVQFMGTPREPARPQGQAVPPQTRQQATPAAQEAMDDIPF